MLNKNRFCFYELGLIGEKNSPLFLSFALTNDIEKFKSSSVPFLFHYIYDSITKTIITKSFDLLTDIEKKDLYSHQIYNHTDLENHNKKAYPLNEIITKFARKVNNFFRNKEFVLITSNSNKTDFYLNLLLDNYAKDHNFDFIKYSFTLDEFIKSQKLNLQPKSNDVKLLLKETIQVSKMILRDYSMEAQNFFLNCYIMDVAFLDFVSADEYEVIEQ